MRTKIAGLGSVFCGLVFLRDLLASATSSDRAHVDVSRLFDLAASSKSLRFLFRHSDTKHVALTFAFRFFFRPAMREL